jgi:quaternary ammonium compound-resistance protein SugE
VWCLYAAIDTIPIGTAYAVWTGVGAVGTALVGIWFFGESAALLRVASLSLIALGLIGIALSSR